MTKIKIGRKSYEVFYDWERIEQLQERFGKSFEGEIAQACIDMDLKVLAPVLAIATGLTAAEITKASPVIIDVVDALTRGFNKAFHGVEEPKESFRESLARKWKTLYYRLKGQRTVTA